MKVLLDTCVWGGTRAALEAAGHNAIWAGDWSEDPGDEELLSCAHGEGRVLITLDKDFGELAIVRLVPHSGIVRLVGVPARRQAEVSIRILAAHGEELPAGAVVTAEPGRLRIRPGR